MKDGDSGPCQFKASMDRRRDANAARAMMSEDITDASGIILASGQFCD
jgi:hypothetical protein